MDEYSQSQFVDSASGLDSLAAEIAQDEFSMAWYESLSSTRKVQLVILAGGIVLGIIALKWRIF